MLESLKCLFSKTLSGLSNEALYKKYFLEHVHLTILNRIQANLTSLTLYSSPSLIESKLYAFHVSKASIITSACVTRACTAMIITFYISYYIYLVQIVDFALK